MTGTAPAAARDAGLAADLRAALAAAGTPGARVSDLRRLSGGASRETWAFDLAVEDAPRPLILQRTRGGSAGGLPMTVEADVLRAAGRHGVPVPRVVASGDGRDPLGAPWMAVDRVEGETIARRILRDAEFAEARTRLVEDAARALVAIHRIPPAEVPDLRGGDPLQQLGSLLTLFDEPHPALELGVRWLDRERPARLGETLVHGDFRLGNLVVGPDGLRAVLDWELAHRGDPMEDLGWLCVRAWRFGAPAPVAGLGEYEELFSAYEAAGGVAVDPAAVRWWEAVGCLRWGAICVLQAHAHLSGASRSVELAAIGRRTCEAEYDLVTLLAGLPPAPSTPPAGAPEADAAGPGLHDRPTVAELLAAVGEYLDGDVHPNTEGRTRFHARVAANVVAMVQRELAIGEAPVAAHRARLAALGFDGDAELVAALRSGALDDRLPEILPAIATSVADKVAVANPGYLADG